MKTYLRKEARRHGSSLQVIDKKKQNAIDLIPKLKDDEAKAESSL